MAQRWPGGRDGGGEVPVLNHRPLSRQCPSESSRGADQEHFLVKEGMESHDLETLTYKNL